MKDFKNMSVDELLSCLEKTKQELISRRTHLDKAIKQLTGGGGGEKKEGGGRWSNWDVNGRFNPTFRKTPAPPAQALLRAKTRVKPRFRTPDQRLRYTHLTNTKLKKFAHLVRIGTYSDVEIAERIRGFKPCCKKYWLKKALELEKKLENTPKKNKKALAPPPPRVLRHAGSAPHGEARYGVSRDGPELGLGLMPGLRLGTLITPPPAPGSGLGAP